MFNHQLKNYQLPELKAETTQNGRFYTTPEGNVYPSVTTVLGSVEKEGIINWKKYVGEKKAAEVLRQANIRGEAVHLMVENYLNNKSWKVSPFYRESFLSLKPVLDKHVDNIVYQEAPLYSDQIKVAGRVDCIAEYDGKLSIIDFKTSLKPKKKEYITNYFMQESVYAACFLERTGIPIKQIVTLIAVDDNEPQIFIEQPLKWLRDFFQIRNQYFLKTS